MKLATSPSNLTEFIQIKEQINYLSRPDKQTDWKMIEKLSNQLLSRNGIDLQSLVYFTVARYQLSNNFIQITKDIENIAIALISYWDGLWPLDISNRISILNWLNRQIADNVRSQLPTHKNIKDLYCLENALNLIAKEIKKYSNLSPTLNNLLVSVSKQIDKRAISQYDQKIENIKPIIPSSTSKPLLENSQSSQKTESESNNYQSNIDIAQLILNDSPIVIHDQKGKIPIKEDHSSVKTVRKFSLTSPFLFLLFGLILGGNGIYFYTMNYHKKTLENELIQILSSPTYLFKRWKSYINHSNEQALKKEWQNKIGYYENVGKSLIESTTLKQQIKTL